MKRVTMSGGLWDESYKIYSHLGGKPNKNEHSWTFQCPGGGEATVEFSHLQYDSTMYDRKGLQAALIAFEELTEFSESQFFYLKSRNRSTCGVKPQMVGTCNPDADSWLKGFLAPWVDENWNEDDRSPSGEIRYFIREDDAIKWLPRGKKPTGKQAKEATSVRFIASRLYDNQILMAADPGYERSLKSLPLVERRRLLDGDWSIRYSGGKLFKKHWFKVVDTVPADIVRTARGWDLAATEAEDDGDDKTGPDFTACVKGAKLSDGRYIILDTQRMRESPYTVEKSVLNLASQDGPKCSIYMEQEPGSGGKNTIASYSLKLAGFYFRGIPVVGKGSLPERARPVSSQAEAGNILILRSPENEAFLNELEAFPNPKVHDDWVSALSIMMNQLFLEYSPSDAKRDLEERNALRKQRVKNLEEAFFPTTK
jgi:predicted phage terminase large subunit-like protein